MLHVIVAIFNRTHPPEYISSFARACTMIVREVFGAIPPGKYQLSRVPVYDQLPNGKVHMLSRSVFAAMVRPDVKLLLRYVNHACI